MKFVMTKKVLCNALEKMHRVGTRNIRSGFEMSGRVTIDAQADKVVFLATNGFLEARYEINAVEDPNLLISQPGKSTVDVSVFKGIAKAIGGLSNHEAVIELSLDGKMLHLADQGIKGKRGKAKMETIDEHYEFAMKEKQQGFSYTFKTGDLRTGVLSVAKYQTPFAYKVRYQMVCFHFLRDEFRFICGDGQRFAVFTQKCEGEECPAVDNDEGVKYIIPADQLQIVTSIISPDESHQVKITFDTASSCSFTPVNGLSLRLLGIPTEPYIAYEKHAFRQNDAQSIVDVPVEAFIDGMALVAAVEDTDAATQGSFHSAKFTAGDDGSLKLVVDENRYQCDFACEVGFKKLKTNTLFESEYAAQFLQDVAQASVGRSFIRFYCIHEKETIIAVPMHGEEEEATKLVFFFAATLRES